MPDPRDIMGELAADDAYRGEYPDWPASTSYPPDRVDAGNEQLGAISNTLRRYMIGPADFVRSIPRGMAGGFADAATALGSATAHEMGQPEVAAGMPTGEQGRDLIEQNVTGPLHHPETNWGRYGESFGQVIGNPSNSIGPPVKTALFNLASGVGGEGMGQLYEGTPYEKAARFAGSISPMIAERASAMSRALPQGSVGAFGGKIVQPSAMGALAEPQGIRAYHSSPHDFERFDASRIGTGEGAQKYGYGLYFAENPEVSGRGGQYWRQFLSGMDPAENEAARRLQGAGWDRSTALTAAQRAESYWGKKFSEASAYGVPSDLKEYGRMRDLARAEAELLRGDKPVGPRTYEVNINARPEQMLDWDKPLAQQPVKDAVLGLHSGVREDMTGQQARDFLLARSWTNHAWNKYGRAPFANDAELSRVLADRGIPGIRYLDQGSRGGSHTPTYNHVIFPGHEHLVDIIKKYGIAGAAPAGLGALASQEQYEQ